MRAQHPDDPVLNTNPYALDEFAVEDANQTVVLNGEANGMLCFECEAEPEALLAVNGPLLDIAAAAAPLAVKPQPLSRIDAAEAQRQKRRRSPSRRIATTAAAARDRVTRGYASVAAVSRRTSVAIRTGKRASRRLAVRLQRRADASRARMRSERETMKKQARQSVAAVTRVVAHSAHRSTAAAIHLWHRSLPLARESGRVAHRSALQMRSGALTAATSVVALCERAWTSGSRAFARPFTETALEHQEFNGFVVAVVLAITVIGYGGFLAVYWRTPAEPPVARAAASFQQPLAVDAPVAAVPAVAMAGVSVVRTSEVARPRVANAIATVERATFTPNTRTLTTLWQRRDTRSLDRAFATLRGETLALRRCGMRVTDADRAVARCDGIVIDFQRTAGRWRIARVTPR